jgi:hypothetical protein
MDDLAYISELLLRCKIIEDNYLKTDISLSSAQNQRYFTLQLFNKVFWKFSKPTWGAFARYPYNIDQSKDEPSLRSQTISENVIISSRFSFVLIFSRQDTVQDLLALSEKKTIYLYSKVVKY